MISERIISLVQLDKSFRITKIRGENSFDEMARVKGIKRDTFPQYIPRISMGGEEGGGGREGSDKKVVNQRLLGDP